LFGKTVPQVAVFDTSFHHSIPERAYLYAVPYHLYRRHRIRRYGFHGTSHRYVAFRYRALRGLTREQTNIITLHLGNGCSAAAIRGGSPVDTSMGMTPLEGLVMGTRSGDLDPAIVNVIARKEGMSPSEVDTLLNTQSGLLGISGLTNDMRELQAELTDHDDRECAWRLRFSVTAPASTSELILLRWVGPMPSCLLGVSGRILPRCVRGFAVRWSGPGYISILRKTSKRSDARASSTRRIQSCLPTRSQPTRNY